MNKGKNIFLCISGLILCLIVSVNSSAEEWKKEPATFLGLKLDSPLQGQIPECPANTMCFKKSETNMAYLFNLPYIGIQKMERRVAVGNEGGDVEPGLSATVKLTIEGNIYQIIISVGRLNNSQLIALAHGKYGPPQESERVEENKIEQTSPTYKRIYTNVREKEYWYGDKINIELLYTVDSVPACSSDISVFYLPGLIGVRMCESMQIAELIAESTANIRRNELKDIDAQRRAIDNL